MNENVLSGLLLATSLLCFSGGHIFLKLGFSRDHSRFSIGIAILLLSLSFLLDLGLLQKFDLSFLYPFHALSVPIVATISILVLREHFDRWLIWGVISMSVGIALVAAS